MDTMTLVAQLLPYFLKGLMTAEQAHSSGGNFVQVVEAFLLGAASVATINQQLPGGQPNVPTQEG